MGVVSIEIRAAYGSARLYPVNDTAQRFARLLGVKTLPARAVAEIEALGFTIEARASSAATDWRTAA